MPYRTEHDTREARREALARALAEVRDDRAHERHEDRDLDAEEQRLLRALRELRLPPKRARLPVVAWERLRIATPCTEDWHAMTGDARVRHCSRCDREVLDLSAMTRTEIAELLERRGEAPCVRFFQRADGTVVTADPCPSSGGPVDRRLAAAACAVAAVAGVIGVAVHEAHANGLRPARVPVVEGRRSTELHEVMGGLRMHAYDERRPTPEPRPPWERPDIVEQGARDLAALRGGASRAGHEPEGP